MILNNQSKSMITTLRRITRGASIVTPDMLASWLRIDLADETPDMIQLLIDASNDAVQNHIGRSVIPCEYRKTWQGKLNNILVLPFPWIAEVMELNFINRAGISTAITNYNFNIEGDLSIPTTYNHLLTGEYIECEYITTPFTEGGINIAILKLAAYMYERRGDCDSSEALINSGAADMLKPFVRVLL